MSYSRLWKGIALPRRHSQIRRRFALVAAFAFLWSFVLATPAQLMAQSALHSAKQLGVRLLSEKEMSGISGAQGIGGFHSVACNVDSGSTYPWEATVDSTNTGNGNRMSAIPIVSWTARGGMPVAFTLNHNSESAHNSELGYKWTHSFDIFLAVAGGDDDGSGRVVHWGDDLSYKFTQNIDGSYSAPTGIHDVLVQNVDGTYTLTRPDQTAYHFKTNLYCDTISDENSNVITIGYNTGNYVTSVTDPTSRAISLTYDGSNRISTITDPLSRVWTCHYTSGNLTSVDLPTIASTTYSWGMSYDSNHNITTLTTPGGRSQTFTYNTDNSLATATDGCGNTTTWTETSTTTTIADANSHSTVYHYSSGKLSSVVDAASQTESYSYDSANNRTGITDKRGYAWGFTFDSAGNVLTATNPYSKTVTNTYNSHNKLLTSTDPLSHVTTTIVYDTHDNPTSVTDALR